jgi:hypothetical protein
MSNTLQVSDIFTIHFLENRGFQNWYSPQKFTTQSLLLHRQLRGALHR